MTRLWWAFVPRCIFAWRMCFLSVRTESVYTTQGLLGCQSGGVGFLWIWSRCKEQTTGWRNILHTRTPIVVLEPSRDDHREVSQDQVPFMNAWRVSRGIHALVYDGLVTWFHEASHKARFVSPGLHRGVRILPWRSIFPYVHLRRWAMKSLMIDHHGGEEYDDGSESMTKP